MLLAQSSNVLCQSALIKGPYLLHQNDGRQIKTVLGVDKVVGGQLGLHSYFAGNRCDNDGGTVPVPCVVLNDDNGAIRRPFGLLH